MNTLVWIYSLIGVLVVSLISFIGLFTLPINEKKLANFLLYFVSFSVGALLGDVFIHLLPEAVENSGFGLNISLYILLGIISSFIMEKILHWRHYHASPPKKHPRPFALMSLIGDSIHNFIDGLIIGGSYLVSLPIGFASTIAVILHEIPQEIGDFGILLHGGFSKKKALFLNFVTALTAFLGVLISLILSTFNYQFTYFLIPFAAGNFIYIAGSDLIPELHKEADLKKGFIQLLFFILGISIMIALLFFSS